MGSSEPFDQCQELTLVMPCYNEEKALPFVLPAVIETCHQNNWALIIVNDGSIDNTAQILKNYANDPVVTVLHHKVNRGYGAALATGISQCKTLYLITIDADGQHNLEDIHAMLMRHKEENADLTIGKRLYHQESKWRRVGKKIIRAVATLLFPGLCISDLNSGIKLYRTEIAKVISPFCPESMAFSDVITLMHVNLGMKVIEYPVKVNPRREGKSTIGIHTAIETVIEILNLLILFKPLKFFLSIALLLILGGLAWGTRYFLMGRGLSTTALLLISAGVILFSTGLLAEQNAILIKATLREKINALIETTTNGK